MEYIVKDYDVRYFAGIEYQGGIKLNESHQIPKLWDKLFHEHLSTIQSVKKPEKFIGLECYPPDFMEVGYFDYYALVETTKIIDESEIIFTKKLPKGKYISFPIQFDDIHNEMQKVYQYIKDHKINIHFGFDFEDYLQSQDYTKNGAILHLSFLLNE